MSSYPAHSMKNPEERSVSSRYREGNWAPVQDELTVDNLAVTGQLPAGLSGMFLRNGPNLRFPARGRYHWYDGDGMVHAVRIGEGRATYLNRYVRTNGFKLEEQAGRAMWTGIMEPPDRDVPPQSPFIRWKKNVANTTLLWHAGRLMALWDTGEPYALNPANLQTEGPYTFGGKLTFPVMSHPKHDPSTGELMIMGNIMKRPAKVHCGVVSREGELVHQTEVDLPRAIYMHDFAITHRHTVIMNLPFTFDAERIQRNESPYWFDKSLPGFFGILPRFGKGSEVQWIEVPACFVAHTVNAYEEGDELILTACRMESMELGRLQVEGGPIYRHPPQLHEWRLNLRNGLVRERQLDDIPIEFPIINERHRGQKARYAYACKMVFGQLNLMDGLVKYDLRDGSAQVRVFGSGQFGGDAEFVPRPGATAEDDGWLILLVHDERQDRSELLVLAADDLTAQPVARVLMPRRVPYGVHSAWIPEGDLLT